MSDVYIVEKKTDRIVATITGVVVRGQNYTPSIREVENLAWKCAIDDKSVDPNRRDDYTFQIADEAPPPPAPRSWS